MTEEIKEILDYLKRSDKNKFGFEQGKLIDYEETQLLLDYITNLQQENEKLKYNVRGQVNDYFKDKYADEVLKKADLIKDFELTCYKNYELKQENERLNNIISELEKSIIFKLTEFKRNKDYFIDEKDIEQLYEELNELKESDNND